MKKNGESSITKTFINRIIWAFVYLAILISLCFSGVILFEKTQYILTYVDGNSMYPTLNSGVDYTPIKDNVHYYDCGLVDESQEMKQYLERNDVIITYYKKDYNQNGVLINGANKKVKRLLGFPGETITLNVDENNIRHVYINGEEEELPYDINDAKYKGGNPNHKNCEITLGDDEYFVIGDNWNTSQDSSDYTIGPVTSKMITGILVKIIGYCSVREGEIKDIYRTTPRYFK